MLLHKARLHKATGGTEALEKVLEVNSSKSDEKSSSVDKVKNEDFELIDDNPTKVKNVKVKKGNKKSSKDKTKKIKRN